MTKVTEFDVVIVGGGAAGCVVAARLAAHGSRSVVLLEAGPDLRADPPESSATANASSRTENLPYGDP